MDTATRNGAMHIPFNTITARSCLRELRRIAKAEKLSKSDSEIEALVHESQCDLHNAIRGLQLQAVGDSSRRRAHSKCNMKCEQQQNRDMGLPIFHALGKILYNKRSFHVGDTDGVNEGCDF